MGPRHGTIRLHELSEEPGQHFRGDAHAGVADDAGADQFGDGGTQTWRRLAPVEFRLQFVGDLLDLLLEAADGEHAVKQVVGRGRVGDAELVPALEVLDQATKLLG